MIWFSYTYLSSKEVFSQIALISGLSISEASLLAVCIIITLLLIFCIFPVIYISLDHTKIQKKKKQKKKLLEQILIQKEIEDEVEKEVHIDDQKQLS